MAAVLPCLELAATTLDLVDLRQTGSLIFDVGIPDCCFHVATKGFLNHQMQ